MQLFNKKGKRRRHLPASFQQFFAGTLLAPIAVALPNAAHGNLGVYGETDVWHEGCVNLKLACNPPPCWQEDVAYVDEHRVLHYGTEALISDIRLA